MNVIWPQVTNFSAISWKEQVTHQWEDDGHFVVDKQPHLDFYSASLQKQQFVGRHVAPIGHNILIRSQPVFVFTPSCCMLSVDATNTNFIVFSFTQLGLEPTSYYPQGEHANHITPPMLWHDRKKVPSSGNILVCLKKYTKFIRKA